MSVKTLTRSFAAGEITPELFGRLDLVKNHTGLETARNFETLPHGPARNRSGFEYVIETKDSTKRSVLIPFIYSTEQSYELEFGNLYMRIHTAGGTVLEAAKNITAITKANPGVVTSVAHGFSNGNWVYLAAIGGMTPLNGRYAKVAGATADTFQLTDLAGNNINTTAYAAYTAGGTASRVYEIATPYLEADLFGLHYTQSADVLTLVHPSYQQRELRRLGATNWTLTAFSLAPTIAAPTAVTVATGTSSGNALNEYKVTAVAADGLEESLGSAAALGIVRNITNATRANPGVFTTSAVHGFAVDHPVLMQSLGGMVEVNGNHYLVNTVPTTTTFTLKDVATGTPLNTTAFTAYTAGGTVTLEGVENNLTVAGNYNNISCSPPAEAVRFNVYKKQSGLFGYIGQTAVGSMFKDDNITPDLGKTAPEAYDPFTAAGDYPGAVGYFQGRRWFAGTTNKRQNLWATKSGTESNMSYSIPTRDDDSIAIRLSARQANTIRHIVPLGDLLLLTSGAEWQITTQNSDAITPTSISYRPQDYIGASNVPPVVANGAVLYPQDRGGRVREFKYSWEQTGYKTNDISLMAPHLFDGYTITSMCFARAPQQIAWATRSDGVLLGLTYLPEHQVAAWHHHDTDGEFESVSSVPEGDEDFVYAIVNRTINGRTVRYIERKHSRQFDELEDAFFVDSGVTYDGAATVTISSGLWHLEGATVSVLADGAVHPQVVVANGAIALEYEASKVHIGLPYTSDLKTLPMGLETQALGQGTNKNVNKAYVRVYRSSGVEIGPSLDKLTTVKQRTTEPYGSPPALMSREVPVALSPSWGPDGAIYVRQSDPLPVTVLSMTLEVAVGG